MVSREEVRYAYRLFLDREPESDSLIAAHVASSPSLKDLRAKFLASPEFQDCLKVNHQAVQMSNKPLIWERLHVDVEVSPDDLARMIRHVELTWREFGQLEPHWSVITNDKFRAAIIDENKDEFFKSGKAALDAMRAAVERYSIRIEDYKDCFEFGCGVGRVTMWLAGLFAHVIAADISAPHIAIAKETMVEQGCRNVRLLKLDELADLQNLPEFDAFFSVIVLQHNPPPIIAQILKTVLKQLRPNGIGYFQVPTYIVGYEFIAREYLNYINELAHRGMEMHAIPQDVLFALIDECGCQLLEIREDGWTGSPTMVSNSVLVRKR
jgi:2-polyprenyl-3-methyl-5-hydroxy-6-metoxy-1,4-benzoquinol methylase